MRLPTPTLPEMKDDGMDVCKPVTLSFRRRISFRMRVIDIHV